MERYQDIMQHARYTLKHHRPMAAENRAAQFAPFAALTGYDEAVGETARLTDVQRELTEDAQDRLNQTMLLLAAQEALRPAVTVTYFQPDARKAGGAYVTVHGNLRFFDETGRLLHLTDGTAIPFGAIAAVETGVP